MPVIELTVFINASIQRCFDLSRSIDLHKLSMNGTREEAISGVTKGLIGYNETVTWRATHFGMRQNLTSRITAYSFPVYFRDEMTQGIFKSIYHEHFFEAVLEGTMMKDKFHYEAPLGILGNLANKLFLKSYMTSVLENRNNTIKMIAESDQWIAILNQ